MTVIFLWLSNSIAIVSCIVALLTPWLTFYPMSFSAGFIPGANIQGPPVTIGLLGCFSDVCDVFKSASAKKPANTLSASFGKDKLTTSIYHGTIFAAGAVIVCLVLSTANVFSQAVDYRNRTESITAQTRLGIQIVASSSLTLAAIFYFMMVVEAIDNEGDLLVGFWVVTFGSCISLGLSCLSSTYETLEKGLSLTQDPQQLKGQYGSLANP